MLGPDPSPLRCALPSVGHPLPNVKFLVGILEGNAPYPLRYGRPKKSIEWVETTVLFSPFVEQSSPNLVGIYGVMVVCNAVFLSTISCSHPEIFATKSRVRNLAKILMVLGRQSFVVPSFSLIFTARQHSLLCRALYYDRFCPTVRPTVRPSDRPSDTVRYHAKTTPATIMRSSLEDSPMTLVS